VLLPAIPAGERLDAKRSVANAQVFSVKLSIRVISIK
jgi:hypothetical protein